MEREQCKKNPEVLVCGYGVVGRHIKNRFKWADIYDKYSPDIEYKVLKNKKYDYAFICVPTPYTKKSGEADLTEVIECISRVNAEVIIIKSTVPPLTTERLKKETGKRIVFSPEYNGSTQHANVEYDFLILGGGSKDTESVCQLYQYVDTAYINIIQTDSKTAELCKYMENCFLATKVTFCNEFYRIAKMLDINYNVLRECFCADPRVNKSHTFVYEKYPYYDSKCLNKDVPALVAFCNGNGYSPKFLSSVIERNNDFMAECEFDNGLEK